MPIVRALDAVRAVPWASRSLAATAAAAVLVAASWLPATVAAAAPASRPALQGQASACPSPAGLRLPEGWTVQFEHPQYQPGDDILPYAAVDPPDPDAGFGMLHRLPPAPDAETALKQRLDFFRDGTTGPMQVRRVDMQPNPNAESTAAAIVLATDEEMGPSVTYLIVATSGTLTCALQVEVVEPYARAHVNALGAFMGSFYLIP